MLLSLANKRVDVAIVGAGPAGTMAALTLAGKGLRVCLLEKAVLPRDKPCGGLMPGIIARLVGAPMTSLVRHRVSQGSSTLRGEHPHQTQYGADGLLLVNRAEFDAGLADIALAVGGGDTCLIENALVTQVIEGEHNVTLSGSNFGAITARAVIAADGVTSVVARCIGLPPLNRPAVAFDAELRVAPDTYQYFADSVHFDFFEVPSGYAWVFPKEEGVLSCGIGSWHRHSHGLRKALNDYLVRKIPGGNFHIGQQVGYPIPVYSSLRKIASARTCLTGDAAGLVDPVSGEGIRFAIYSGKLAAETILDVLQAEDSGSSTDLNCHDYERRFKDGPGRQLTRTERLAALPFHQAPEFYYRKFVLGSGGKGIYPPGEPAVTQ